MRIIQSVYCIGRGGAETLTVDICTELQRRSGIEVKLVSFAKQVAYELDVSHLDFSYFPTAINFSPLRPKAGPMSSAFNNLVESFQPDIIHTHLFRTEIITRSITFPSASWFTHCHNNMPQFEQLQLNSFFSKEKLTNWLEKNYLSNRYKANGGTSFIAVSEQTKRYFEKNGMHFPVYKLLNAIPLKQLEFMPKTLKVKSELKLINIGNFTKNKNQKFLVEVLELLVKSGVNADITFLGDGQELESVQKLAHEKGLSHRTHFLGNVENVYPYLKQSDIYVHSSYSESFGLSMLEGMAAGLPVVALNAGGNAEFITHGKNGFIHEEHNPLIFANQLVKLFKSADLYNQIASQAFKTALKFGIESYVDDLLNIYSQTIESKKAIKQR